MKRLLAFVAMTMAAGQDTWLDPASHLMWTTSDNHSGISWRQSVRYCADLRSGGFADWRLPVIDELQSIYQAQDKSNAGFHVKGPLQLTGWQWSGTAGRQAGENWAFDFGDGGRASVADGDSGLNRALCVREEKR